MSDIFDTLTKNNPNKSSGDVFDQISPSGDRSVGREITSAAVGIPAIIAGSYGAYRAGKGVKDWWQKPQKLLSPIEEQLDIIRKQYPSWKGTSSPDIPSLISGKAQEVKTLGTSQIKDFTDRSIKAQNILKERLNDFDTTIRNPAIEDLSTTIKTKYPQFLKDTYAGYKVGLDAIEGFMEKSGVSFKNTDIAALLEDTIDNSIRQGVPETQLVNARKLVSELTPVDSNMNIVEKPIKFTQAKGYIRNISKDLPPEAQYSLGEKWGQFLETDAPPEVKGELQALNKAYTPVAQAKNTLNKFINRQTGLFNTKGINDYLTKYVASKIETGTKNLLQMLGEGNELASPIEGVKEKVSNLENLKTQRSNLQQAIEKTKVSRQSRAATMDNAIRKQLEELLQWKNKADVLVSQREEIINKYPKRTKGLARAATVVGEGLLTRGLSRAMFPMSVIGNLMQAAGMAQDYKIAQQRGGLHQIGPNGELVPVAPKIPPKLLEMIQKYGEIKNPNVVHLEDYIA